MVDPRPLDQWPLQAFIPFGEKVDPALLPTGKRAITNDGGFAKPKGGFWTSTLRQGTTEWLEWCRFEMPHWIGSEAAVYRIKPSAVIERVATNADVERLQRLYPQPGVAPIDQFRWPFNHLDWERLAQECDAIMLEDCSLLYGWDAESTVWFNPGVLELVGIAPVEKLPDNDNEDDSFRRCANYVIGNWK